MRLGVVYIALRISESCRPGRDDDSSKTTVSAVPTTMFVDGTERRFSTRVGSAGRNKGSQGEMLSKDITASRNNKSQCQNGCTSAERMVV